MAERKRKVKKGAYIDDIVQKSAVIPLLVNDEERGKCKIGKHDEKAHAHKKAAQKHFAFGALGFCPEERKGEVKEKIGAQDKACKEEIIERNVQHSGIRGEIFEAQRCHNVGKNDEDFHKKDAQERAVSANGNVRLREVKEQKREQKYYIRYDKIIIPHTVFP